MSSRVPKELNDNWGQDYGLDGFQYDMDYGHALHSISPGNGALSGLPGDLVAAQEDEEGESFAFGDFDLGDMGVTAASLGAPMIPTQGIVDHHWLSDAVQDPARLPRIQDSLTQLQILWGDRTDGFFRVPAVDRIEDVVQRQEIRDEEKVASTVQRVIRAYSVGKSDADIIPEIGEALWALASPWVKEASQDKNLLGKVYLYAGSFPGLTAGPWRDEFVKAARFAKYLVVPRTASTALQAKIEETLGLKVILSTEEIPWQQELQERTGLSATSPAQAKKLLAKHLGAAPVRIRPFDGQRTSVKHPDIPLEEAKRAFQALRPDEDAPKMLSLAERESLVRRRSAHAYLKRWARCGLLGEKEVRTLLTLEPSLALQKAARLVAKKGLPKQGAYSGPAFQNKEVPQEVTKRALEAAFQFKEAARIAQWEAQTKAAAVADYKERRDQLRKMVRAGWITPEVKDHLMSSPKSTRDVLAKAEAIAATPKEPGKFSGRHHHVETPVTAAQVEEAILSVTAARASQEERIRHIQASKALTAKLKRLDYILSQGTIGEGFVKEVQASLFREEARESWGVLQPMLRKAAELATRSETPEFQGPQRYAHSAVIRPQREEVLASEIHQILAEGMHKGLTGKSLTASLVSRVPVEDLIPHAEGIRSFRARHEGKMGLTFIDAAHFASERGTKGCEIAAAKKFASTVEGVLGMDQCKSCVAYDGTHDRCMTYSRPMLWDVPTASILPRSSTPAPSEDVVAGYGLEASLKASLEVSLKQEKEDAPIPMSFGRGMNL